MNDRFARVKELLLEVADLGERERQAYLDDACKDDPELRREVEAILAHEDDPDGVLKTGAMDPAAAIAAAATTIESTSPMAPDEIAGYRIVRKLGEGGMGVVYEAEQRSPRRPVALKVIRGGSYVDEHRVRLFQREAQALGHLKHPGIAAIYESGGTEAGQHFFAMELVRGVPLDEYLRKHSIEGSGAKDAIRQRLDLFLQVCDAISYAHQRGVIHRDLKPGNILVLSGSSGSRPRARPGSGTDHSQVKILDFGLARMTDADVAVTTMVTEVGKIQGTLAYMSPEQARGNPDEIDIRSDVYALGVLLYEMLTGTLPYDVRRTMIHEAVRVICEQEPARPSTLERTLRGDLETIALKALEKEPGRRYQSVAALAEDIDRYLTDQPILARAPSATYQLRKLVARHRASFAFVAMIMLALSVGLVLVTVQNTRIAAARDEAEQVTTTLEEMLASVDPTKSGRDVTVKEMLDETAKTLREKFKSQPRIEARLRRTIGNTYYELGEYDSALEHRKRVVEIQRELFGDEDPRTLAETAPLVWAYQRQSPPLLEEAEALARKTLETSRRVFGEDDTLTLRSMNVLGLTYQKQKRYDEAAALFRASLETGRRVLGEEHPLTNGSCNFLGQCLRVLGQFEEADSLIRRTLAVTRRVHGEESTEVLMPMTNLAESFMRQGRIEEAATIFRDTLELRRRKQGVDHFRTINNMQRLATCYGRLGRYGEAEALLQEALELLQPAFGKEDWRTLDVMNYLGYVYGEQGRLEEAEAILRETLPMRRRVLGEEHRGTLFSMENLARVYLSQGRYDEAEALFRQTLEISRRVRGEHHNQTNELRCNVACALARQGRGNLAISFLREALDNGYRAVQGFVSILDDPDLASLHGDPEFEAIVEELKRRNEDDEMAEQAAGAE